MSKSLLILLLTSRARRAGALHWQKAYLNVHCVSPVRYSCKLYSMAMISKKNSSCEVESEQKQLLWHGARVLPDGLRKEIHGGAKFWGGDPELLVPGIVSVPGVLQAGLFQEHPEETPEWLVLGLSFLLQSFCTPGSRWRSEWVRKRFWNCAREKCLEETKLRQTNTVQIHIRTLEPLMYLCPVWAQ